MNRNLRTHLATDEQQIASKLESVAEDMKLSSDFQWDLEHQLIDVYKTRTKSAQSWQSSMMPVLGWAIIAIGAIVLLSWTLHSRAPELPPAAPATAVPELSFEASVRQGDICFGSLALVHEFSAFLTNEDKTSFVPLDTASSIGEVRSIVWSADGKRLAVIGNTTGSGTIYIAEPEGGQNEHVLSGSNIGYLWDAAWSRDGQQFVIWLPQKNALYLVNSDGTGLVEKKVGVQILGNPQFAPDGNSLVFYGGDMTATGLFEITLTDSVLTLITPSLEDESGFAFSPDGSLLAYIEHDRDDGEARLFTADMKTGERAILGTWPIPDGSGAALPEAANLSWSPDGSFLVFDLGYFASQRAVYLVRANGSGLAQILESGYAPTISSDGRCLAFISGKQVFLLDLAETLSNSSPATPVLLANLPFGRSHADTKLDKLQWRP